MNGRPSNGAMAAPPFQAVLTQYELGKEASLMPKRSENCSVALLMARALMPIMKHIRQEKPVKIHLRGLLHAKGFSASSGYSSEAESCIGRLQIFAILLAVSTLSRMLVTRSAISEVV